MMNSLCGSSVSLKSENNNSRTKVQQPTTPSNDSVMQSKKNNATQSSGDLDQTSLTPPSLNLPSLKFDLDGDVEVQSPDSSMWESFFADHIDGDFMISSPVRTPQAASSYNCNYNYAQGMQGQSLSGCSPPRFSSSQIGAFNSSSSLNKGKGLSPLHRVFNSPNNQYMQHVENLSLPAIEEFLEDYQTKVSSSDHNITSSSECFDLSSHQIPSSILDGLALHNSSRYHRGSVVDEESTVHGGGGGGGGSSQLSQESDIYHQMGSMASASLSQALQQERYQEKQQKQQAQQLQQQQRQHQQENLMVPIPIEIEQVKKSSINLFLFFITNVNC